MKWYEGNIPSAIQKAKEKHALFVVYISGTDDVSKNMDKTWADKEVGEICEQNKCVVLKLEANSESCGQFCMIYPVVCVPSTFFIGENGVPLEVTGGHLGPSDFVQKIQKVVQMHNSQKSGQTVEPLTNNHGNQSQHQEQSTAPAQGAESSVLTQSTKAEPSTSAPGPTVEEKMEKARELVKARREETAKKEAEEMKKKDEERKARGKDLELQKLKDEKARKEMLSEWQKDKEDKKRDKERVREQLARDREEKAGRFHAEKKERERLATCAREAAESESGDNTPNVESAEGCHTQSVDQLQELRAQKTAQFHAEKEARQQKTDDRREIRLQNEAKAAEIKAQAPEHLKEQLISDREEKNARFRTEREEREKLTQDIKRSKMDEQAATEAQTQAAKMERSRIQFRLPDGSSLVNQFSSADTLQTARDFLSERVGGKFGKFTLSTHHPRRDFTDGDCSQTLLDLDLAPSAIIIVLPGSRSTVSRPTSEDDSSGLVTLLLAPFTALWNFVYYFLFSSAPSSQGGAPSPGSSEQRTEDRQTYSSQRDTAQGGLRRRQDGNMTRLSAVQDDDEDDRTTWNGNSTQQM